MFRPPRSGKYTVLLEAEHFSAETPPLHFRVSILHSAWGAATLRLAGAMSLLFGGLLLMQRGQKFTALTTGKVILWLALLSALTIAYARFGVLAFRIQTLDMINGFWYWVREIPTGF